MNRLLRRLIELVRPAQLDRETLEELSHHIELLVERKLAAGLDEAEARRRRSWKEPKATIVAR